jgi:hypothetical protein
MTEVCWAGNFTVRTRSAEGIKGSRYAALWGSVSDVWRV